LREQTGSDFYELWRFWLMLINLAHLLCIPILWFGLVFGPYMLIGFKAKSPSSVIRVLYGIYFIALFFYAMIWSPLSYLIQFKSPGFYIGLAILALILIPLIIMSINQLRKVKKEGN